MAGAGRLTFSSVSSRPFSTKLGVPHHALVPGAAPPQVQDFAVPLVKLQEAPVSPPLQPFKSPKDNSWNCNGCNLPSAVEQLIAHKTLMSLLHLLIGTNGFERIKNGYRKGNMTSL